MYSNATTMFNVTPTGADSLDVSGELTLLDGRLSVIMSGDFTSGPTRYILLHSAGPLTGTFSNGVSIKYPTDQGFTPVINYDYVANNVYLDLVFNLE